MGFSSDIWDPERMRPTDNTDISSARSDSPKRQHLEKRRALHDVGLVTSQSERTAVASWRREKSPFPMLSGAFEAARIPAKTLARPCPYPRNRTHPETRL